MSEGDEPVRCAMEVEGRTYVYLLRGGREGGPEAGYSFDNGKTWNGSRLKAYLAAKEANALVEPDSDGAVGGEFEVWLVDFVNRLKSLAPGESVKVVRTHDRFLVTQESIVAECRASSIGDVDLSMTKEKKG